MREYRSYHGSTSTEYSTEDRVFHGPLLGIRTLVGYESETEEGLQAVFEEAVDDYLELYEQTGSLPETP